MDAGALTLAGNPARILLDANTTVFALTKPVERASLAVGRSVTVETYRNAQGQLVAQRITITPTVLHSAGPPAP